MTTQRARDAIYSGRAVRSGQFGPTANAWLRREAAAGRVKNLTGLNGWCPAHSRWTFYVSSNHAPAFVDQCREDHNRLIGAAIMDEYVRGRYESAARLQGLLT